MDGQQASVYALLFSDPLYLITVVNTLLFVGIGGNGKIPSLICCPASSCAEAGGPGALLAVYLLPRALPALTVFLSIH